MLKESKQVIMLFMLMQVNDPEENVLWYQFGQWAGLEIVDEEEEERMQMRKMRKWSRFSNKLNSTMNRCMLKEIKIHVLIVFLLTQVGFNVRY